MWCILYKHFIRIPFDSPGYDIVLHWASGIILPLDLIYRELHLGTQRTLLFELHYDRRNGANFSLANSCAQSTGINIG